MLQQATELSKSPPIVRGPNGTLRQIRVLAGKEMRDALRNRWFILYAALFAVLTSALAFISIAGAGVGGVAGFGRTAAGLVNVILLIVPLMALTVGAGLIAGERDRGTLEYLLAQPISRGELLAGKYLGAAAALLAALTFGFGVSLLVVASRSSARQLGGFLTLVLCTDVLALAMLSVGLLISAVCKRTSVAVGAALIAWFALVFLTDLGLMGSAMVFRMQIQQLFWVSLLNPMQVFKMSVLGSIHASLDVLGPAGTYATRTCGSALSLIFAAAGAAWVLAPAAAAWVLFVRRSEA